MFLRAVWTCAAILPLAACGVIYTVPEVDEGPVTQAGHATGFDVEIVPLTYETAAGANLQPYIPPRLPLGFQPDGAQTLTGDPETTYSAATLAAQRRASVDRSVEHLPPIGQPQRYRIGIGDVLLLASTAGATSVAGLPALITAQSKRTGYTVQDDGAIAVPDAGRIPVAGMTMQDAESAIFRALAAAGIDPSFSLEVAEFNSQRATVRGMVGSPKVVPITLQPLTLEDALTLAGGIVADDPIAASIRIYRDAQVYRFSVERYLDDPKLGRILLRDGDSVYVGAPADETQAARDRQAEAQQVLASDRDLFEARLKHGAIEQPYAFLAGEFGRTVELPLPFERNLSLANVIFSKDGGGLDMTVADYAQIYVLRRETDPMKAGGMTAYHLNASNVANLAVATEFDIHANDIVFVATQPVTSWNRVLSQLTPTPQYILTARQQAATF